MKVFLSWSGEPSKQVAKTLRSWLPRVIQALKPFMSEEDIPKGTRWATELGERLDEGAFGIVCVTPKNIEAPWMIFEAGALARSLAEARVTPFLVGLSPTALKGPLTQFQATVSDSKDDVGRLLREMNDRLDDPLAPDALADSFDRLWPELQEALAAVELGDTKAVVRSDREVLDEILLAVRGIAQVPSIAITEGLGSSGRRLMFGDAGRDLWPEWPTGRSDAPLILFFDRDSDDSIRTSNLRRLLGYQEVPRPQPKPEPKHDTSPPPQSDDEASDPPSP